jgi:uncharacterized membrane protein YjjP (DUF1212 family)
MCSTSGRAMNGSMGAAPARGSSILVTIFYAHLHEWNLLREPMALDPVPPPCSPSLNHREAFVLRLGAALHRAGAPAHRLETALMRISEQLGLQGAFFSTPTSLTAAFGDLGAQRSGLARVTPGDAQLERLVLLDATGDAVMAGELDLDSAEARVAAIEAAAPRFGPRATTVACGLVSAAAVGFFDGTWGDVVLAGLAGLAVGLLQLAAGRLPALRRLFLPVAAATATALASVGAALVPGSSAHLITLCALIVMVPGLSLTVAANELATGHLVSGTARMTGAAVVFLQLGLGVVAGSLVGDLLPSPPPGAGMALPPGALWVAGMVAAACLVVLFQARPTDAPVILLAALVALATATAAGHWVAAPGPAFVGALAVGLLGNAYARLTRHPSLVAVLPGILLLVPGSVGFEAVSAMLQEEVLTAVSTAFSAMMAAVALAAGLLVASAALPARRSL